MLRPARHRIDGRSFGAKDLTTTPIRFYSADLRLFRGEQGAVGVFEAIVTAGCATVRRFAGERVEPERRLSIPPWFTRWQVL